MTDVVTAEAEDLHRHQKVLLPPPHPLHLRLVTETLHVDVGTAVAEEEEEEEKVEEEEVVVVEEEAEEVMIGASDNAIKNVMIDHRLTVTC